MGVKLMRHFLIQVSCADRSDHKYVFYYYRICFMKENTKIFIFLRLGKQQNPISSKNEDSDDKYKNAYPPLFNRFTLSFRLSRLKRETCRKYYESDV